MLVPPLAYSIADESGAFPPVTAANDRGIVAAAADLPGTETFIHVEPLAGSDAP
ncbi:hypothetical protein [Corynebacterium faecale]|uniref:hypothetical protein n=1 Tax=Corynebacterium faecale TaxID=1758466 RepID=UPI0025B362E9|nr:hypothetical protein [Corynebacterium faecale]